MSDNLKKTRGPTPHRLRPLTTGGEGVGGSNQPGGPVISLVKNDSAEASF